MLRLPDQPIRYAHFGGAESSHRQLMMIRDQVRKWQDTICDELSRDGGNIIGRCVEALLDKNSCLRGFYEMDRHTKNREMSFIGNGVRGFGDFLKKRRELSSCQVN